MSLNIDVPETKILKPKITVLGIGGAGGNAVNNMMSLGLQGVNFAVANTDAQSLENSLCETKLQLGESLTRGLGAGSCPDVGAKSAEESLNNIMSMISNSNMVFITAGMGGGTGTGAAPIIAKACREQNILTVGVVTKPFHFEGAYRMDIAEKGVEELYRSVDTLIVIPNQNLFHKATEKTTFAEAFNMVDNVLYSGIKAITDLMTMPGLINLDFADIRTIMGSMGKAMMGTGEADGEKRALEASEAAISNPLLDSASMKGASGVLINISGGLDMTLFEADEAAQRIKDEVDSSANIIFGSTFDKSLEGKIRVSVVATGICNNENRDGKSQNKEILFPKVASLTKEPAISNNVFIPPAAIEPVSMLEVATKPVDMHMYREETYAAEVEANLGVENISLNQVNNMETAQQQYARTPPVPAQPQFQQQPVDENNVGTTSNNIRMNTAPLASPLAANVNNFAHSGYSARSNAVEADKLASKKSLGNLFNFFKESINFNEFSNKEEGEAGNITVNDQNNKSGLSISDDMLNVPTFMRKNDDQTGS
ncbi:MAG: cell division protein FtsZ [Rickettsiales bacterium]|mgnify:CR=1 FL=1|jgi:cell division protein FtsZ|nr:cell division protein FtsZ [Rickettsiales bacterium]